MNGEPRVQQFDAESTVKTIVAWASVSYAFGFFVVMLYTSRLELPVVQLIEPIYIWIGFPLAIVAFFSRWIYKHFRMRSKQLSQNFRASIDGLTGKLDSRKIDFVSDFMGTISSIPMLGWIMSPWFQSVIEKRLGPIVDQAKTENPEEYEKAAKYFSRFASVSKILNICFGFLNLSIYAFAIVAALFMYVWVLYPMIPQGFGGGRPTPVDIVVDQEVLSPELIPVKTNQNTQAVDANLNTVVLPVELIYQTEDFFFFQLRSGTRFSIKTGAINSIIWN